MILENEEPVLVVAMYYVFVNGSVMDNDLSHLYLFNDIIIFEWSTLKCAE